MNDFLKILGDSKMNGGDPVPFFEDSGSLFWESECTVILSKVAAGMVCRGDILIQYIPKTLKNKEWAGRVIGCYRATSHVGYRPYSAPFGKNFDYFCRVENLYLKFANRAKDSTFVHVDELGIRLNGALESGIMRLSREQGEKAVAFIERLEERL